MQHGCSLFPCVLGRSRAWAHAGPGNIRQEVTRLAAGVARTLFPVPDLLRSGWFFQLGAIEGFGWC